MAKISPVSIKYMINASFRVEGSLEKPDIIGAIFGQTEGLLGSDLEMRELQKEGKIGRIEVDLEKKEKITNGIIKIPTALDQAETTLIAAAIETIEKIGPCDAQVDIEKIEDVRSNKRGYIVERAKKLMEEISSTVDSREISKTIKDHARTAEVKEYGPDKLPYGELSEKEIIVVEGRADVLNLMRAGVKNVIAMNGTKLPDSIRELSLEKEITLFVDGDRGGKLILMNVIENAKIENISIAPDGKEVEELTGKEILMCLRKKIPVEDFLKKEKFQKINKYENSLETESKKDSSSRTSGSASSKDYKISNEKEIIEKLKEIYSKNQEKDKTMLLDSDLNIIKKISTKSLSSFLKNKKEKPFCLIINGTVTKNVLSLSEELEIKFIVAKNFSSNSKKIKLLSF